MKSRQKVATKSLLVAIGLVSVSLICAACVFAADKGLPDNAMGNHPTMRACDNAEGWHGQKGHAWYYRRQQVFRQLNLTDQQKATIHEIRLAMKKDMVQKRAEIKLAKIDLREQMHKENAAMASIETQVKKIEALRTAVKLNAIKARMDIKNVLTLEQRKKFTELMQAYREGNMHLVSRG